MSKSPELRKLLGKNSEFRFFDNFGNILDAIDTHVCGYTRKRKREDLQQIQLLKNLFYDELDEFSASGYVPKGKINRESINAFYEFQNLDWSADENIERVKTYMSSLRPEK